MEETEKKHRMMQFLKGLLIILIIATTVVLFFILIRYYTRDDQGQTPPPTPPTPTITPTPYESFNIEGDTIVSYEGDEENVVIPSGYSIDEQGNMIEGDDYAITTIAGDAFSNKADLVSITIPASVTTIEAGTSSNNGAFSFCVNLETVKFEENSQLTTIGSYAFYACFSLRYIDLPQGVTNLGSYAFSYCENLIEIKLPDSLSTIGIEAFSGCVNLTVVELPASLTNEGMPRYVFSYCYSLVYIVNNSSTLTFEVGDYGTSTEDNPILEIVTDREQMNIVDLNGNRYKDYNSNRYFIKNLDASNSVTIDNSANIIHQYAFADRADIISIEIPSSVEEIEYRAFFSCSSLTSIEIPSSVVVIGTGAFDRCYVMTYIIDKTSLGLGSGDYGISNANQLLQIVSDESQVAFVDIDGNRYKDVGLERYFITNLDQSTDISIDSSATAIANYAFYDRTDIKSITIPSSVTRVGNNSFNNCVALREISLPSSITELGASAFYGCSSLTSVEIPSNITTIDNSTFYGCSSLTSIHIPSNIRSIENYAFTDCVNLSEVIIDSSYIYNRVTSISSCGNLVRNATTIRVLTSCIGTSTNSYLEDTANFTVTIDGDYTVYTKIATEN